MERDYRVLSRCMLRRIYRVADDRGERKLMSSKFELMLATIVITVVFCVVAISILSYNI